MGESLQKDDVRISVQGVPVFLEFHGTDIKDDHTVVSGELTVVDFFDVERKIVENTFGVLDFVHRILEADSPSLLDLLGEFISELVVLDVVTDDEHNLNRENGIFF